MSKNAQAECKVKACFHALLRRSRFSRQASKNAQAECKAKTCFHALLRRSRFSRRSLKERLSHFSKHRLKERLDDKVQSTRRCSDSVFLPHHRTARHLAVSFVIMFILATILILISDRIM